MNESMAGCTATSANKEQDLVPMYLEKWNAFGYF